MAMDPKLAQQYYEALADEARDHAAALEHIVKLRRELNAARSLIRWCYHDDEEMPANYAEIVSDAVVVYP